MKIVLNYEEDKELFNIRADEWAKKIAEAKPKTENNQIRNFYEYVLKYYNQIDEKKFDDILPFIKMLNSKVAYARNRSNALVNDSFVEMVNSCVNQVNTKDDLKNFKLFFEALIGFYYKYNNKQNKEKK